MSSQTHGWWGFVLWRLGSGDTEEGKGKSWKGAWRMCLLSAITFQWTVRGDLAWGRYSGIKYEKLSHRLTDWSPVFLTWREPRKEGCCHLRFTNGSPSYRSEDKRLKSGTQAPIVVSLNKETKSFPRRKVKRWKKKTKPQPPRDIEGNHRTGNGNPNAIKHELWQWSLVRFKVRVKVSCTGGWKAIPCVKWEHGLEETGKLPVKTKRFSNNLTKEEAHQLLSWALTLAPDLVDTEKAFPGICFPLGPRGVWANADGVGGLGVDPFPNCIPQLLEKRNEEGGLQELEFGLKYEKLRQNGTSGKEISAKQGKLLLFFSSTSKRASNSVSLSMSASWAGPRRGPLTPKESKFTCLCWLVGSLPENPLPPPQQPTPATCFRPRVPLNIVSAWVMA